MINNNNLHVIVFEAEHYCLIKILVPLSVPSPRLQTHKAMLQLWAFHCNRGYCWNGNSSL